MAQLYISPTGNDSTGDGSSGNPWQTVDKFVSTASSGDTCNLAAGTYTWSSENVSSFNFVGPTLALGGALPTAILDAGNTYARYLTNVSATFTNIWFKNYTTNDNSAPTDRAFLANSSNTDMTFTDCAFSGFVLDGNQFGDGGLAGTQDNSPTTNNHLTFSQCVMFDFEKSGGSGHAIVIGMKSASSFLTMTNVTVYLNPSSTPSYFTADSLQTLETYKNFIIYDVSNLIAFHGPGGTPTYAASYSDFYQVSSAPSGTGTISADPMFVDPNNANFNLRPGSPCRATGSI